MSMLPPKETMLMTARILLRSVTTQLETVWRSVELGTSLVPDYISGAGPSSDQTMCNSHPSILQKDEN